MKLSASFLFISAIFLLCSCAVQTSKSSQNTPWLNSQLTIDERVDALVNEMTMAEKVAQMYNEAPAIERLGVPAYNWWNEALHGVARAGKATVFPQAIGMAAMFDKDLMLEIGSVISDEARAKHHYYFDNGVISKYTGLTFWSPNINIFRDPRWGRGQETYGEDPYLTAQLAVPFIRGLQGNDEKYLKTSAMAKHFAVHSGPEKSRHSDDYHASPRDLYETYLPAFEAAVLEGEVESVMCAYNRVNGDPACGSDFLLKNTLRENWKFKGHVVSDCGAISDFYALNAHNVVTAPAVAAAWAVRSGTDLNCGTGHLSVFSNLHFALQKNLITEAEIDQAVKRLFRTRFKLGLFDAKQQVPFANIPMSVVGAEAHLSLSEKAARQSLVLLKNNGVLPLQAGIKVAVIGPNATNEDVLVGNYNGTPVNPVTPLTGIKQLLGEANVFYAAGSALGGEVYGHYQTVGAQNLFHYDNANQLVPGLKAQYYRAQLKPANYLGGRSGEHIGEPVFTRVDKTIDFYWQTSPIDNSVWGEFGVVWQGVLKPQKTGLYRFNSIGEIKINNKKVEQPILLEAGNEYALSVGRMFLRTEWGNTPEPSIQLSWVNESEDFIKNAITAANKADVIIFAGGISPKLEGEEMKVELDGFDYGDRTHINLPKVQQHLLKQLKATGKPVVLINFSGSAMALNEENRTLDGIVQAFYPGEATGKALADLLWGNFSPSGKLPVTFYRGVDDLPGFKDYSMSNRTYKYYRGDVLYPFGYGLSYNKFEWSDLSVKAEGETGYSLTAKLKNMGATDASQVSQVYISLEGAPSYVPIRKLVAFDRTHVPAGQTVTVQFKLDKSVLGFINEEGQWQKHEGAFLLSLGDGQPGFKTSGNVLQLRMQ